MKLFTVVAAHNCGVIGVVGNKLPWPRIDGDLAHFKKITTGGILLCGRKTYESMPNIKDRDILVLSSKNLEKKKPSDLVFSSFDEALNYSKTRNEPLFVIGGSSVFAYAMSLINCFEINLTEISGPVVGVPSSYFPSIPENFNLISSNSFNQNDSYQRVIKVYRNKFNVNSAENVYLNSLKKILVHGYDKSDRTGIGTRSVFGETLRFNLQEGFPLLTTKKMLYKSIIEELLFFLRGDVDNDILKAKGVSIWNGNTTREFLDKRGLVNMEEGSLGKAYGFQWRFWGAPWLGKKFNYKSLLQPNNVTSKPVVDQISKIIHLLNTDPDSRRIVLSAYNVSDLDEMCLEPCHTLYVFNTHVENNVRYLNCHLTQRSGDMFLGIPFNIASLALLISIIAKCVKMQPGEIMITIADAHIYKNHFAQCTEQISRIPYYFPKLNINREINSLEDIEKLTYEDFTLSDYVSHPFIKAPMAV